MCFRSSGSNTKGRCVDRSGTTLAKSVKKLFSDVTVVEEDIGATASAAGTVVAMLDVVDDIGLLDEVEVVVHEDDDGLPFLDGCATKP
jgi:hypothetical protein